MSAPRSFRSPAKNNLDSFYKKGLPPTTARIVDVTGILAVEYAENEVRKESKPSERQVGNRRG
jgi:hypothetical protein